MINPGLLHHEKGFHPLYIGSIPLREGDWETLYNDWGIRKVVSLVQPEEWMVGSPAPSDLDIEVLSFPIPDGQVPEDVSAILDGVREATSKGATYLHCFGGCGRTGVVAICYLLQKGVELHEALKRVRHLRGNCPETDEQKWFVLDYAFSCTASKG